MAKKKEVKTSETYTSDGSEEWQNFERGLKQIFSLTPQQAKVIRESKPNQEPEEKEDADN